MLLLIVRGLIVHASSTFFQMDQPMSILQRFGQRVREKRTALGLSQEAFAYQCKLDRTYISGIERGKRNVALRNIDAIAKALGTTISELTEEL